jgi:hypothetical protein
VGKDKIDRDKTRNIRKLKEMVFIKTGRGE